MKFKKLTIKNKKGVFPVVNIILLLSVFASLITVLSYWGVIERSPLVANILGSADPNLIYTPNWGSLRCEKADSFEHRHDYLSIQNFFTCGKNEYTEECAFFIKGSGGAYYGYKECDINGQNCGGWNSYYVSDGVIQIPTIKSGRSYVFNTGWDVIGESSTYITKEWYPWRLRTHENGGVWISRSTDCCFAPFSKDQFLKGEFECLSFKDPNNVRNYVKNWVATSLKTYAYLGKQVICDANALYNIDTFTMESDNTYKVQGSRIKYVECCPHQTEFCGTDFKFHEDPTRRKCTYSYECENAGDPIPISQITSKYQSCDAGYCEWHERTDECTSSAVCRQKYGEGWVCELSRANYGVCVKQPTPTPYCGDGRCDIGETNENCPSDCKMECAEDEKLVTTIKKVNCIAGFPLYWGCDEQVEHECVKEGINFALIIALFVFAVLVYVFRGQLLALLKLIGKTLKII